MAAVRYDSALIEKTLARAYTLEMSRALASIDGLNDIKPQVQAFERDFARYIGTGHAVAVNSGSDALKMMLLSQGIGKGDEVIIADLTYQAVALAVIYCGAVPVMVDARAEDLTIDPARVAGAVTRRTKAVIAAHMFGRPCDLDALMKICRQKKLVLLEDVCQAESSCYKDGRLGSFGTMAAFSFSYYKPLSSCGGGGGMVLFNDPAYRRITRWMEDWQDDPELLTTGQRFAPMSLMDLVALRVKWRHLPAILKVRRALKAAYEKALTGVRGVAFFTDGKEADSVPQNFVVMTPRREGLVAFLKHNGVAAQRPYVPLHRMKAYTAGTRGMFPVSDAYGDQALHLPLHSAMTVGQVKAVVRLVELFMKRSPGAAISK